MVSHQSKTLNRMIVKAMMKSRQISQKKKKSGKKKKFASKMWIKSLQFPLR